VALRNTLVVHRVMEVEQIRWQRVLKFREFVRLRGHD